MILLFLVSTVSNDDQSTAIFKSAIKEGIIQYTASGSSKQRINGSFELTKPEYAFDQIDKTYDWCSNCGASSTDFPWIQFSLTKRKIELTSYYIKSGCCSSYYRCCCEDKGHRCCECCLYSWQLQISDDNKTWTPVHSVEKDYSMRRCRDKKYTLDSTYTTRFVRLIQTEACPGDPPCIALNKIELYGKIINDDGSVPIEEDFVSYHDDDDSDVSIIGHISRNNIK